VQAISADDAISVAAAMQVNRALQNVGLAANGIDDGGVCFRLTFCRLLLCQAWKVLFIDL
jgi:Ran GTPase-activating protein (RanGAP) involved in mRNA processing and transport